MNCNARMISLSTEDMLQSCLNGNTMYEAGVGLNRNQASMWYMYQPGPVHQLE